MYIFVTFSGIRIEFRIAQPGRTLLSPLIMPLFDNQ